MQLRVATEEDIPTLEHWDKQEHVIAAGGDDDEWDWPEEVSRDAFWQELLIAELNGRPMGMVQIIDPRHEESHYWGSCPENLRAIDIWIGEADDLGRGYGTEMMRLALLRCIEDEKVTAVLIDPLASNKDAIRFYERLGFCFVENRRFGDDDCCVYQITREQITANHSQLESG